jgi:hypothetical protein
MTKLETLLLVILAAVVTIAATTATRGRTAEETTRACAFATGGWTEVDCSAGAAYSSQLVAHTRYVLQAIAGDAYFAQTSAGSGADADSSDGYIPEGSWVEISTVNGNRYYSCDGSAATAKVRHVECQ